MQAITQNRKSQGKHGKYNAVDYSPYPDPIYYAPEDGTITFWGEAGTMGLALKMQGATGLHGFGHNEHALVKVGDKVKRGQPLAKMGYTGLTEPDDVPEGTHVHWVIYRNGVYVYPPDYIDQSFIKLGEDMIKKEDLGALRIGMSEIEGWNGHDVHKGKYDKQILGAWVGKEWKDFIWNGWNKQKTHRINLEDSLKAEKAKSAALVKQVNELKAQHGNTDEATIIGKALLPILSKLGYKKG